MRDRDFSMRDSTHSFKFKCVFRQNQCVNTRYARLSRALGRVSALSAIGRGFDSRPRHTKDVNVLVAPLHDIQYL